MERIIDVLPIILLGIGQLMQATIIINLNQRVKDMEEYQNMILKALHEALLESNHGNQE